ncbi:hypothetical protein ACHAWC_002139 [Mediolabrus comicus]
MGICSCVTNDCITQPQLKLETALQSVQNCNNAAKQTINLCTSTLSTGDNLVTLGKSIQDSLLGAVTDLDAESFAVIADLIDGDMTREAKTLATSMREQSDQCIELSMSMVKSLEDSVDELPDTIERYIEKKAQQAITEELSTEERGLTGNITKDIDELSTCIDAIDNLKLLTAIQSGSNAFMAIASKSEICRKVFDVIRKFATSITSITQSILELDISAVISKVKDILTAIGLCRYIKEFAEGCRGLMEKIVDLFEGAADKLSLLWKALTSAKERMADCLADVIDAHSFCDTAGEKMKLLRNSMDGIDERFNPDSPLTILTKSFSGSSRLGDSINVAREIDDQVAAAKSKMEHAANAIAKEYKCLPPMITDGISESIDDDRDVEVAAKSQIAKMESELKEFEKSLDMIKSTDNSLTSGKLLYNQVSSLPRKMDTCEQMIDICRNCASKGKLSIDTFLGKWSLETAVSQIQQMCRLVITSRLLEEVAMHIRRMLLVMSRLLEEIMKQVKSTVGQAHQFLSESGVESRVESLVDSASEAVVDKLDSMMGKFLGK